MMQKTTVFNNLRGRGAAKAVVSFSGGDDEGGVNDIELFGPKGNVIGRVEEHHSGYQHNPATGQWEQTPIAPELQDEADLAEALGAPVYAEYHSFAGEFYVQGTVTWDVAAGTVLMHRSERSSSYEDSEMEF